ncbi:hypothetical protein EYC84_007736 [Monilinia fructicola]|uniref:Uncharacterized protein n=1 Tax=Monilinia fructicola TaxID=38448 RepID=A0A5M9JJB2_MONFR|nr:hypothetical protein EYC84_007736 [Monilinia fructicola]
MSVCTWGISARRGAGYHASSSFTDSFHFRLFLGAWASGLWLSWGFWYGYLVVGWYMGGVTDSVEAKELGKAKRAIWGEHSFISTAQFEYLQSGVSYDLRGVGTAGDKRTR